MSGLKKENGNAAVNKNNPSIPQCSEKTTKRKNGERALFGKEKEKKLNFCISHQISFRDLNRGGWRCEVVARGKWLLMMMEAC